MSKRSWEEWLAWIEGPIPKTMLTEEIDYSVDYSVKEVKEKSARERADERWRMK